MGRVFQGLVNLPRFQKQLIILAIDAVLLAGALWLAYSLRLGVVYRLPGPASYVLFSLTVLATVAVFVRIGLYRAVIRYINGKVITSAIIGVSASALMLVSMSFLLRIFTPRSVPVIYWCLALIFTAGTRLLMRFLVQVSTLRDKKAIVIYGAGVTGRELANALLGSDEYLPIAFVDDDEQRQKYIIHGLKVFSPQSLPKLLENDNVEVVLLALDKVSHSEKAAVLGYLESFPCRILTVPSTSDVVGGKVTINDLREIDIEDLLGRDPVAPVPDLLSGSISRKAVMVTGAGGSIGSELCRQIVKLRPSKLVLVDVSEYGLYQIEQELTQTIRKEGANVSLAALLGSVQKEHRMEVIMRTFGIQTVYHAAAYKHVPIVEENIVEGVRNNVFGTWYLAEAAVRAGVENFVLISTDKAVRPTNVMGASKRFAELVLQGLSDRGTSTKFCMVRFGNVLGSSGSVVPLFRQQILAGGPVTVTHPDVYRYFMTIPEAAQLVLQACSMAEGGEVFVLDMGEPVRILELARKMIHLMGYEVKDETHPGGEIEIQFTGLRPGEKLYEELLVGGNPEGTQHQRIMKAAEVYLSWEALSDILSQLDQACHDFDCASVVRLLGEADTGYSPDMIHRDLVANGREGVNGAKGARVLELKSGLR